MNKELNNKVALVTGATSGIGKAISQLYAENGATVMLSGRNENVGQQIVKEIIESGGNAKFFKADVSDPEQCAALINETVKTFGKLDIACNNAGIASGWDTVGDYSLDIWHEVINVNLNGVFYCMKYELEAMSKQMNSGVVINISSILGQVATPFISSYVAAKHGVVGLTKCAALEYAAKGIRINAVGPAYVQTPILDFIPTEIQSIVDSLHPIGRKGTVREVAELVSWLSSDRASFITGSYYPVDGGYLAQ